MRIAHYLEKIDFERGGVVRAVVDMCTLLASRGHAVTVFTTDPKQIPSGWRLAERDGDASVTAEAPGVPEVVPLGPAAPLLRLRPAQLAALRAGLEAADVLHIHACWNPANNQLARLADTLGLSYVQSVHGMLDDWSMAQSTLKKRIFLALGGRRTLRNAAAVHCTAAAELEQARRWFAPAPGVVVPLVMDLAPYAHLPGPELARETFADALRSTGVGQTLTVLFLSRVHYKKGPEAFVRTIKTLRDRGIDCRGLIAGPGERQYLGGIEALIRSEGLDDRVTLIGSVSGQTKISLYQLADLFLLPTSQENFGFVFPEALACETPVITTTGVDTHPDLSASGGAVIVGEPPPEALADAAAPLLRSRERRAEMGRRGRDWVLAHLDSAAVAGRFEEMYAAARDARTRPAPAPNRARP